MSKIYNYGARNGLSIITDLGKVQEVKFVDNVNHTVSLTRESAEKEKFFALLKFFMDNFAKSYPTEFMKLFFSLNDDVEALELATKAYNQHIDKLFYPIESMKMLMNESDDDKINGEILYYGMPLANRVVVINGTIMRVLVEKQVERKDWDFCEMLVKFFIKLAESDPKEFMILYDAIKEDSICFELADKVRKKTIKELNKIFRFTI